MIEEYDGNLHNKIQLLSIEKSCRICITSSYEMSNIFNEKHPEILEKIEFCTGILLKPEDGLPAHICGMCSKNLTVAFDFKTKCIFSDKILRKLCTAVKEEHNCISEIDYEDDNNDFFTNNNATKSKSSNNCEVDVAIVKTECVDAQNDFKKINLKTFKCKTVRRKKKKKSILRNREVIKKKKVVEESAEALEPKPPIEFPCAICDLNFDNKKSLVAHRKEKHSSKDGLICEICGKLFPRASYSTHLRTHRTPNYKCDHCDYGTVYKSDLVKHVQRHCGNTKTYKCDSCTCSYYTCSSLYAHRRLVHQGERRFPCTHCEKRFNDRSKLQRHIDTHFGVKRYECEICHSCYTRRCYWKRHLLKQHNIETPRMKPGRQRAGTLPGDHQSKRLKCNYRT